MNERVKLLKEIVVQAGSAIKETSLSNIINQKDENQNFATIGDLKAEQILMNAIQKNHPDDLILSEETSQDVDENTDKYLWVIDPIDGSNNYAKGLNYSGICVAITRNKRAIAGAIYNPFVNELYFAEEGKGSILNDVQIHTSHLTDFKKASFATDNYYDPSGIRNNLKILFRIEELERIVVNGSAALQICEVAAGRVDLYMHTCLKPWDNAAAFVIAKEAGAQITNLHGENIDFYSKEIVVANPELLKRFVERINRT